MRRLHLAARLLAAFLTTLASTACDESPASPSPSTPATLRIVFLGPTARRSVNDQNSCDENPTGAVTRNVFANDVPLIQNTTTPGNGDEPGYALTLASNGAVSQ